MVRPKKTRMVRFEPDVTYFKPQGVPLHALEEVELTVDELEALRLSSVEKLSQEAAAKKMKIHQSTLQRMLSSVREKLADALVNGKAIKIHGGTYKMAKIRGKGRMGGKAAGPGGLCVCPKCGHEQAHIRGQACTQTKCDKCGSLMARR